MLNLRGGGGPISKGTLLESTRSRTRSPSTKVPFALPRSTRTAPLPRGWMLQCRRETPSSSTRRSASPRPMTVSASGASLCSSPTWGPESTNRKGALSSAGRCGAGAEVVFSSLSMDRGMGLWLRSLPLARPRDVEGGEPLDQGAPGDPQRDGGLGLVAGAACEGVDDALPLRQRQLLAQLGGSQRAAAQQGRHGHGQRQRRQGRGKRRRAVLGLPCREMRGHLLGG